MYGTQIIYTICIACKSCAQYIWHTNYTHIMYGTQIIHTIYLAHKLYTHMYGTIFIHTWRTNYIHNTYGTQIIYTIFMEYILYTWDVWYTYARGGHFNFLPTPMRGWVGVKLAGMGVFLVQSGRFLVVQKFNYINLRSNIWILAPRIWFLAPRIWFLAPLIWVLAPYTRILAPKLENRIFSKGVGGVGESPRTSGRIRHRCRGKIFRPPLAHMICMGKQYHGTHIKHMDIIRTIYTPTLNKHNTHTPPLTHPATHMCIQYIYAHLSLSVQKGMREFGVARRASFVGGSGSLPHIPISCVCACVHACVHVHFNVHMYIHV